MNFASHINIHLSSWVSVDVIKSEQAPLASRCSPKGKAQPVKNPQQSPFDPADSDDVEYTVPVIKTERLAIGLNHVVGHFTANRAQTWDANIFEKDWKPQDDENGKSNKRRKVEVQQEATAASHLVFG
ncbi:hypothetical protein CYMTET_47039 [Cymbomonas tetramitiformis]|uniref:Uncharacterized protein n=1 Tax=Cymbomonas tetramitiformis TaxID=36881 RepID=A0AAE0BWD8_9CHLO|nr:hypothetical protein CYMTET_47039 [Cymbomonas tetramitiformis]